MTIARNLGKMSVSFRDTRIKSKLTMARTVEQISSFARVEVEEDTRNDNALLLQASLKEIETIVDGVRQAAEIEPEVERCLWN